LRCPPRAFLEFCGAAFDLQLQPVVGAGARVSFAMSKPCERAGHIAGA
jgi:hypothetical protein